jgi:hypothetical protein
MGVDEVRALDIVERALGDAIAAGNLVPGAPRWHAKAASITEAVLSRPLDLPPGQTLAGLVTTERIGTWIDSARHPVHQEWRSAVANRLLHSIEPPSDSCGAVAPMRWLLERAAEPGGTELTQSNYLARATVLAAVELFGWWDWDKPPTLRGGCPSALDAARRSEPTTAGSTTRSTAAPHDPRCRASRLTGSAVGTSRFCGRRRRGLHPCRDGAGRPTPPSGTGRATRARRRGRSDPHHTTLVNGRKPDHREPRLFGRLLPTSLVATLQHHRRDEGHVGIRHGPGAHAPHHCLDARRRADGPRISSFARRWAAYDPARVVSASVAGPARRDQLVQLVSDCRR